MIISEVGMINEVISTNQPQIMFEQQLQPSNGYGLMNSVLTGLRDHMQRIGIIQVRQGAMNAMHYQSMYLSLTSARHYMLYMYIIIITFVAEMGQQAAEAALRDAGIQYDNVQAVVASYCYGDPTCGKYNTCTMHALPSLQHDKLILQYPGCKRSLI